MFKAHQASSTNWRIRLDERYASLDHNAEQHIEVVAGCFMLLPKHVIEQTSGFNPNFFMYAEEAEWCFRIKQAGFDIAYIPSAEIMHHGAASSGHLTAWKMIEMARGKLLFLELTRSKSTAYIGNILMLFGTLTKLLSENIFGLARVLKRKSNIKNNQENKFSALLKKLAFHLQRLAFF